MKKIKAGILPHYLELYDKVKSDVRPDMESFLKTVSAEFRKRGVEIIESKICRLSGEFEKEIKMLEKSDVQAIISLHLAYSPSLESAKALASTKLPIVILDTTPDYEFSPSTDPGRIMFNHGIHGVQDMCNLLIRNGKKFSIETGHWKNSDVIDRVVSQLRAATAAHSLRNSRTGIIGSPFKGMGDFAVSFDKMKKDIGINVIPFDFAKLKTLLPSSDSKDVKDEINSDRKTFKLGTYSSAEHISSTRASIAVRRWINQNKLNAFSMNFLESGGRNRLPTVPFLEASKAMSRGIGYAGEGDVLTASLVGALLSVYPETTFTEMFCPDWKSNRLFFSHMGEANIRILKGKADLTKCGFPIKDTDTPLFAAGIMKPGRATLINVAPGRTGYSLIISNVEVKSVAADKFKGSVRGWISPKTKLENFLTDYSSAGGTHHLAMVYGDKSNELAKFAEFVGWKPLMI